MARGYAGPARSFSWLVEVEDIRRGLDLDKMSALGPFGIARSEA